MTKCTNCGYENAANAPICERCGQLLTTVVGGTKKISDTDYEEGTPKWGSARFHQAMNLVLDVQEDEADNRFTFDANQIEQVVIGRKDPETGDAPEVDLTDAKGIEKGVSRRHALIVRRDGALHVMDNHSANGTFLNGQRLVANQPRILRDGDDIRLGHLILRVTFSPMKTEPAS